MPISSVPPHNLNAQRHMSQLTIFMFTHALDTNVAQPHLPAHNLHVCTCLKDQSGQRQHSSSQSSCLHMLKIIECTDVLLTMKQPNPHAAYSLIFSLSLSFKIPAHNLHVCTCFKYLNAQMILTRHAANSLPFSLSAFLSHSVSPSLSLFAFLSNSLSHHCCSFCVIFPQVAGLFCNTTTLPSTSCSQKAKARCSYGIAIPEASNGLAARCPYGITIPEAPNAAQACGRFHFLCWLKTPLAHPL